ncbi:MAG: hypothetical protein RBR26_11615 [Methanosarcina mazei]|nr:hypothetical protein [Methanosarcina mazei]
MKPVLCCIFIAALWGETLQNTREAGLQAKACVTKNSPVTRTSVRTNTQGVFLQAEACVTKNSPVARTSVRTNTQGVFLQAEACVTKSDEKDAARNTDFSPYLHTCHKRELRKKELAEAIDFYKNSPYHTFTSLR